MVGVMPDKSFDEELLEDSEYSRKSDFSKAIVCQNQVVKCMELRSRDMRPGYTTWINDKPTVIPDSRKEFVGSVIALKNLLSPEIAAKVKEMGDQWDEAVRKVFEKYAYKARRGKIEKVLNGITVYVWDYTGDSFIPQKGATLMCQNDKYPNTLKISYKQGIWDSHVDSYWDEMVDLADELFAELNNLIHILDYFKGGISF